MESQFSDVIENMRIRGLKKVIVFCDTSPLQNFICDYYNKKNVDTYSFQHGFYIEDHNEFLKMCIERLMPPIFLYGMSAHYFS